VTRPSPRPPARVLHVVSNMDRGGAETMLMNYYRRVDRTRLQFDFLVHAAQEGRFDREVSDLGGRIIRVASPGAQGPWSYVGQVRREILRWGPFVAVHSHTDSSGALAICAARLAGVPRRIVHAHSTGPLRQVRRPTLAVEEAILKLLICATVTQRCACGKDAGTYLFGDLAVATPGCVTILPNAIDMAPFAAAWDSAADVRRELAVPDGAFLLGHVANLTPVKNHRFVLRLARALHSTGLRFRLLLIGDGPLRAEVESGIVEAGLTKIVRCLGVRSDVPRLLRALDLFLLPSLFEGLPLSLIEAQTAGAPCLVSDTVTTEGDLDLQLVSRLSLDLPDAAWVEAVKAALADRKPVPFEQVRRALGHKGFDVAANLAILDAMYGTARRGRRVPGC